LIDRRTNGPAVICGDRMAGRLLLKHIRLAAAATFAALELVALLGAGFAA
jgi:putative Ca2+/H+ antiporter (TMEM165/GDT1 family)